MTFDLFEGRSSPDVAYVGVPQDTTVSPASMQECPGKGSFLLDQAREKTVRIGSAGELCELKLQRSTKFIHVDMSTVLHKRLPTERAGVHR